MIAERLKMLQGNNNTPKKEEKKQIQAKDQNEINKEEKSKSSGIQERLRKFSATYTTPKKDEKDNKIDINKNEENIKQKEEAKNKFAERIKMMQGGNNTKKEEIKEPPKKINNLSLSERLKAFSEPSPKEEKEKEKEKETEKKSDEKPKSNSRVLDRIKKARSSQVSQNTDMLKKIPNKIDTSKFGGDFASKLSQMNEMFRNQGADPGQKHRFSVTNKHGKFDINKENKDSSGELKKNESSNLGIIMEEPDKTKEGYDPSSNLQQTLDSVVIKKNKKKKKPPTFDG